MPVRTRSLSVCLHVLLLAQLAFVGCTPRSAPPVAGPKPVSAPARRGAPSIFEDVAQSAGVNYKWVVVGKRPLTILQTIGNGVAFLDYDNDGNLDILLVGNHPALYRGDGKGHFTDVTHATGLDQLHGHFLGCAVGDYDNDGYPDIYLSAYRGGALLHNEAAPGAGGRLFRDVTKSAGIAPQPWGTSCTFTDFDGDGKLDLYIGNYVKFGPNVRPQLCDFHGILGSCGPRYYNPEFGVFYRNVGGGRFVNATSLWAVKGTHVSGKTLGVAAADFDGSGHQGLAIANDEMSGDLLQNLRGTPSGTGPMFQNIGVASGTALNADGGSVRGGMGVDWGDYDNDGKLDLVVATYRQEAKCLFHNAGAGVFVDAAAHAGIAEKTTPYVAFGIKFLDYDNDGFLDLIIANGHVEDNVADIDQSATYREPTQLFHNVGGERFVETTGQAGESATRPIVGRGLAIGDFDNDGRMDVLIADSEGAPLLLHNVAPASGHWLLCRLVGTKSNRDGIGALVTFDVNGRKLLRRCATDGSYLSASDKRVHVGLGSATSATITVHWPSGITNTFKDVKADHIVTLTEGKNMVR